MFALCEGEGAVFGAPTQGVVSFRGSDKGDHPELQKWGSVAEAVRKGKMTRDGSGCYFKGPRVLVPPRPLGCATAHNQRAVHGVSCLTSGVRCGL